jgi:hypothetical protein
MTGYSVSAVTSPDTVLPDLVPINSRTEGRTIMLIRSLSQSWGSTFNWMPISS